MFKMKIISIGIKMLFSFFKLVSRGTSLTYFLIGIMFIDFVFVLDKMGENIVFIVLFLTPLLMIDKKEEKDFKILSFICILMFLHILSLIGI